MAYDDGQAGIWLSFLPKSVFLCSSGTVTLIALLVHYALLTYTTWFSANWEGGKQKT